MQAEKARINKVYFCYNYRFPDNYSKCIFDIEKCRLICRVDMLMDQAKEEKTTCTNDNSGNKNVSRKSAGGGVSSCISNINFGSFEMFLRNEMQRDLTRMDYFDCAKLLWSLASNYHPIEYCLLYKSSQIMANTELRQQFDDFPVDCRLRLELETMEHHMFVLAHQYVAKKKF